MSKKNLQPLAIIGSVQHYDWGETGSSAWIRDFAHKELAPEKPLAELWIGSHPSLPADVIVSDGYPEHIKVEKLNLFLQKNYRDWLPRSLWSQKELPFLLKALACDKPLSLQVHPDLALARSGYKKENRARIAVQSPQRIFKDANSKPELIIAVSDFYAFYGLFSEARVRARLKELAVIYPKFQSLFSDLLQTLHSHKSFRPFLEKIFHQRLESVQLFVKRWIPDLRKAAASCAFQKSDYRYWVLSAIKKIPVTYRDPGLFLMAFLNVVHLRPEEALFIHPGEIHSYLSGRGIEVMANSDNTLRCGLTTKPIHTDVFLRAVNPVGSRITILKAGSNGKFSIPAPFKVQLQKITKSQAFQLFTGELWFCIDGNLDIAGTGFVKSLTRGQSLFWPQQPQKLKLTPRQSTTLIRVGYNI